MENHSSRRQDFFDAINRKQPQCCPYHVSFTATSYEKMKEFYNDLDFAAKIGNCFGTRNIGWFHHFTEIEPGICKDISVHNTFFGGILWD